MPRHGFIVFLVVTASVVVCSGFECFVDPAWKNDPNYQIFSSVPYGSAFNNQTNKTQQLTMDMYFPPKSDNRTLRPAAVLIHGGSFTTGDSTSDDEPTFARKLVQRGYVAVSINYRLTGNFWGLDVPNAGIDAAHDAKAAVRFLRKHAVKYGLDPARIMMAGDSAGAITAAYVGYAKVAAGEGQSGNPGFSSHIRVAIAISGELKIQAFCKTLAPITFKPSGCLVDTDIDFTDQILANQPPLLAVHGTLDPVVPYVNAKEITDRMQQIGLTHKLITIPGASHVPFDELWSQTDKETGLPYQTLFFRFLVGVMDLPNSECPTPSVESQSYAAPHVNSTLGVNPWWGAETAVHLATTVGVGAMKQ